MARKTQDYYFKKARKENYPSRSVYKLEEVQQKYGLLRRGDSVLDLGCHPGSWALYTAKIVGVQGLVVGVDLKPGRPIQGAGAGIIRLCVDIMVPEALAGIRAVRSRFRVVLSDMAPATSGNKWVDQQKSLGLARQTLEIVHALLDHGGNYFVKVFQGEDFQEFVAEVRSFFKTVKVVKPKSSRTESREVYVLGLGYQRPDPERTAAAAGQVE
ncbi:MAG: RlmE family RNA methyltransferase [Desulfobacterales bacterium]|nr:RlmE family RNA methyltransferase [Desulfobacterales bacterium]